ncbi:MAG: hypothetical protein ACYSOI_07850 [Planctomycetota bacterium]
MMAEKLTTDSVSAEGKTQSKRIASIDWMRGIVMILMIGTVCTGDGTGSRGVYHPVDQPSMCPDICFSRRHGAGDQY